MKKLVNKMLEKSVRSSLVPTRVSISTTLKKRLSNWQSIEIDFRTKDGVLLRGTWYPGEKNTTIIMSHMFGGNRYGWTSNKNQTSIDIVPSIEILRKQGFSILVFDHRGCGESEGDIATFGFKEKNDIIASFEWINSNNVKQDEYIFIGYSQGASAVLLALKELEQREETNFKGILINTFWFARMFSNSVKYHTSIPGFMIPIINQTTCSIIESDLNEEIQPAKIVAEISSPLMFIQAKKDDVVSDSGIETIYQSANEPKELLLVEGTHYDAYHAINSYCNNVIQFINRGSKIVENKKEKFAFLAIEYQKNWTDKGFFNQLIKKQYMANNVYEKSKWLLKEARKRNSIIIQAPLYIDKSDKYRYKKAPFIAKLFKQLTVGSWKSEFTDGIYHESDIISTGRSSYDATVDSDLIQILEKEQITSIVLLGFTTNHCLFETYETLRKMGYRCFMASEGTAAMNKQLYDKIMNSHSIVNNETALKLIDKN